MKRKLLCTSVLLLSCCAARSQNFTAPVTTTAPTGATTTDASQIQEFQKVEDRWADAVNARDQYGLELVLAPLFVNISASGDITTRNQQVAQLISNDDKSLHLNQRVITVRMLGDIAVTNGTYTLHHKTTSGPTDEKGIFTHVFERVRNGWVCVNSQQTVVRDQGPAGKGKKKQSDAELPFHIPLFSKSDKSSNN